MVGPVTPGWPHHIWLILPKASIVPRARCHGSHCYGQSISALLLTAHCQTDLVFPNEILQVGALMRTLAPIFHFTPPVDMKIAHLAEVQVPEERMPVIPYQMGTRASAAGKPVWEAIRPAPADVLTLSRPAGHFARRGDRGRGTGTIWCRAEPSGQVPHPAVSSGC